MGVITNIIGTTSSKFQIGVNGTTIYQSPNMPPPSLGIDGDLFIKTGSPEGIFQKISGVWIRANLVGWSLPRSIQGVGANSTKSPLGSVAIHTGAILGISILLSAPRTAGNLSVRAKINGTIVGQTIINATNPLKSFSTFSPIQYMANDVISIETITTGFSPAGANASVTIFCADLN